MHELRIERIELVGGNRQIEFDPSFGIIKGSITTGKTTTVRLLKALLGRVPDHLPPETGVIRSVRGRTSISGQTWVIDRPLVTTKTAMVSLGRREPVGAESSPTSDEHAPGLDDDDSGPEDELVAETLRLPAEAPTATESQTFQNWVLDRLGLPQVSVPRARTDVTSPPTPVTINDWLIYCVIKDDEIDTAVFGHRDVFIDRKRRAVFELIYGIYDEEMASLQAQLRSVELQLEHLDRSNETIRHFLKDTAFSSLDEIDSQLDQAREALRAIDAAAAVLSDAAHAESSTVDLRREIAQLETQLDAREREASAARRSLAELGDLRASLDAQSRRLTRAIVADEWLVDFDFMVCPRCGTEVAAERSIADHCYLCLQEPRASGFHDELIKEQERIASQVVETADLVETRQTDVERTQQSVAELRARIASANSELSRRTQEFVSLQADLLTRRATERAQLDAEVRRLTDYRQLFIRFADIEGQRAALEEERVDLADAMGRLSTSTGRSEQLIRQLEGRFLDYLQRLHVSLSDLPLTAGINRTTYLPEVTGRPFDELSSQGLSVLVNVAHALAHHTVAIDNDLPLPGLLVLDGLSTNVGHEGFDLERRDDTYRLLMEEAQAYLGQLQIIAVDNDVPDFAADAVVLTLSPEDRLVRSADAPGSEPTPDE